MKIWPWSQLAEYKTQIEGLEYDLMKLNRNTNDSLQHFRIELIKHNLALGRIIAKLDPTFTYDMSSPEAKAESDRISKQVMDRLLNDHKAARHSTGEPI